MSDQTPLRPEDVPNDAIIVPEIRMPYTPPRAEPPTAAYTPPTAPYAPPAAGPYTPPAPYTSAELVVPPAPPIPDPATLAVPPAPAHPYGTGQIVPMPPAHPGQVAPYPQAGPPAYPAPHPSLAQPGYPIQQPGYPYDAQPTDSNGIAVAGFIVGLVSIFMPLILGVAAGVTGIILSSIGISRSKFSGRNRGIAVAGLVLAIIGTVLIL